MIRLGTIILSQVQRKSLKVGTGSQRIYDPSPITEVPQIMVTHHGVIGLTKDDERIMDVHHARHSETRNRGNANGISVNFLKNYDRMQQRFPNIHLPIGMAGENLVIETASNFSIEQINANLIIQTQHGESIALIDVIAIPPCAPFSNYLAGKELGAEDMRATLEFLSDGTRGFYATLPIDTPEWIIRPGDELYAT